MNSLDGVGEAGNPDKKGNPAGARDSSGAGGAGWTGTDAGRSTGIGA
ncbi:hypothetical protein [Streptomyces anulatus]|nr:hypothetical protein [Streptomyces anulatus]